MRNIDVKLHHLVQIWASASARARLRENFRMPIEWGTPSWDGLMTGLDWLESLEGFMSGFMCAKTQYCQTCNHCMDGALWWKSHCALGQNCIVGFVRLSSGTCCSKAWSLSDLIANDNWLNSKHEQAERLKRSEVPTVNQVHDVMFLKSNRARSKHMKVWGQLETDLTWQVWL